MDKIVRMKEDHQKSFYEKHKVNLTFFPLFLKAVSQALLKYPKVNASKFHYKKIV